MIRRLTSQRLTELALVALLGLTCPVSLDARTAADDGHASSPIPAFARMYGTACSTCHTAAPKLNVLGEAFRLNGYEMPLSELLERIDSPVSLGAEPWKAAWPRAIWPGQLPGALPMALRVQSDVAIRRGDAAPAVEYRFPHEVYLLAGGPLGGGAWTFLEVEWDPDEGLEVAQAKVGFRNLVPGLPDRALSVTAGYLNPFLLTFTDRQIDRAARQKFSWQSFRLDEVDVRDGEPSRNGTVMGKGTAAIEVSGLLGGRLHWGAGLAQGGRDERQNRNGGKDPYYRLRYKLGGLDFEGHYPPDDGPVPSAGGQLLDRAFVFEHFGYFGDEATATVPSGTHRAFGWAVRRFEGALDVGVGHVRRRYMDPFATGRGAVHVRSWFAKGEYLLFPWLIGSVKYDRLTVEGEPGTLSADAELAFADRRLLMPGLVALVRQNIRLVAEGQFILDGDLAARDPGGRPHALWLRMDLSF